MRIIQRSHRSASMSCAGGRAKDPPCFSVILTVTAEKLPYFTYALAVPKEDDVKSTRRHPDLGAVFHQRPAEFGEHARAVTIALGGLRRSIAVEAALVDALHDG